MTNNTFLQILSTFSKKELQKFSFYLHANHPNLNVELQIFDFYKKLIEKKKAFPELKIAYQKIFGTPPPKGRRPAKLQNGFSDLNILIKDYLTL